MTTNNIPLGQLDGTGDGLRRDRWGRLLVVPPNGEDPEGYTRTTTIAKATDDGGGLAPWKATLACVGLMLRPGLRAQWEAMISAHDGDPWYASQDSKAACRKLVEECARAGGASDRAEVGTALHAIIGSLNSGFAPKHLTPETERDIEAYRETMAAAGIQIAKLPWGEPAVEVTVVNDDLMYGGSFDLLASWAEVGNTVGLPMIGDLKTGAELSYSWGSFAVQLAGYSRCNDIYVQGPDPNGSTDERWPMPPVDQDAGLIIHLPAGEGRCDLYLVDLEAGWEAFELSIAVRSWRQARDLVERIDPDRLAARRSLVPPTPEAPQRSLEGPQSLDPLRGWLQDRIDVAGAHSDLCRADLVRSWPAGVPPLKASTSHTGAELAAIESVLDDVEARHSVAFGPSRPGDADKPVDHWVDRLFGTFPNTTVLDNNNSNSSKEQQP